MFGKESSEKGKPFEMFMLSCFLNPNFQNKKLSELPFLKSTLKTIPKWFDNVIFNCKNIINSNNPNDDMKILEEKNIDVILSPSNKMRLDGLYVPTDKKKLFYPITIAIKSSCLLVNNSISMKNFDSSCLTNIYTTVEDNKTILDDCKEQYEKFHNHFDKNNIGGEIRILIEYPKYESLESFVSEDEKLVLVYLNQDNLNLLIDKEKIEYIDSFKKILQIDYKNYPKK
jgi:hypothetical protein